jgi:hypothetical protein
VLGEVGPDPVDPPPFEEDVEDAVLPDDESVAGAAGGGADLASAAGADSFEPASDAGGFACVAGSLSLLE